MSDIIPDTVQQISKVSVGTVSIIVVGVIFGAYLWLQLEIQRDMVQRQDRDRDRLYEISQSREDRTDQQVERFISAMEFQAKALSEIAAANDASSEILREIKQDQKTGTAQLINTVTTENRAVMERIEKAVKAK